MKFIFTAIVIAGLVYGITHVNKTTSLSSFINAPALRQGPAMKLSVYNDADHSRQLRIQSRDERAFIIEDLVINNNPSCTFFETYRQMAKSNAGDFWRSASPPWPMKLGDERMTPVMKCNPVKVVIFTDLGAMTFTFD